MKRTIEQIKARKEDLTDAWPRYGNEEDILTLLEEIRRLEGHLTAIQTIVDNPTPNRLKAIFDTIDVIVEWEQGR